MCPRLLAGGVLWFALPSEERKRTNRDAKQQTGCQCGGNPSWGAARRTRVRRRGWARRLRGLVGCRRGSWFCAFRRGQRSGGGDTRHDLRVQIGWRSRLGERLNSFAVGLEFGEESTSFCGAFQEPPEGARLRHGQFAVHGNGNQFELFGGKHSHWLLHSPDAADWSLLGVGFGFARVRFFSLADCLSHTSLRYSSMLLGILSGVRITRIAERISGSISFGKSFFKRDEQVAKFQPGAVESAPNRPNGHAE